MSAGCVACVGGASSLLQHASAWAVAKLRELMADGLNIAEAAGILSTLGVPCTARQVKRWKEKYGIRSLSKISDAALDAVVQNLHSHGQLGDSEGYRWVHSEINKHESPQRVGLNRVCKALRRTCSQQKLMDNLATIDALVCSLPPVRPAYRAS